MNNLVAYGDDSDEESPRRRSHEGPQSHAAVRRSTSPRQRRDSDVYFEESADSRPSSSPSSERSDTFAEPPPPKRRANDSHSPSPAVRTPLGMSKVTSVSSLVSYAGGDQDEEESFDKAEREETTPKESSAAEPAPPPRISQDGGSDDEDERMIDRVLEESSAALREIVGEASSTGSPTPARNGSPQTPSQPELVEDPTDQEIRIPPSPPGECNPAIQKKFERAFEQKAGGHNLNQVLQNMPNFLNPSCYETFIKDYELQEMGSNFAPEIFDPSAFPESCYYDSIAEEQRKIMERNAAEVKKKTGTTGTR